MKEGFKTSGGLRSVSRLLDFIRSLREKQNFYFTLKRSRPKERRRSVVSWRFKLCTNTHFAFVGENRIDILKGKTEFRAE